jgi:hypothetical protein
MGKRGLADPNHVSPVMTPSVDADTPNSFSNGTTRGAKTMRARLTRNTIAHSEPNS